MGNFQNPLELYNVTIASGGSFSGSVYLGGNGIIGLGNAGTWTSAPLTFQTTLGSVGPDAGGTWVNVYTTTSVAEYSVATLSGTQYVGIPPSDLPSLYWVRLRSGNAAAGTNQAAERTITLFTRPV